MIENNLIVVNAVDLKTVTPLLIQLGMFNSEKGRYSGLLSSYQQALNTDAWIKCSFAINPDIGGTINIYGKTWSEISVVIKPQYRNQGNARRGVRLFGQYELYHTRGGHIDTQGIVTRLIKEEIPLLKHVVKHHED